MNGNRKALQNIGTVTILNLMKTGPVIWVLFLTDIQAHQINSCSVKCSKMPYTSFLTGATNSPKIVFYYN
jgi:hypothetical protein